MTENLLLNLEENMMKLLSEVETLRVKNQRLNEEVSHLHDENTSLKFEKEGSTKKIENILALIQDTINISDALPNMNIAATLKPVLVQG